MKHRHDHSGSSEHSENLYQIEHAHTEDAPLSASSRRRFLEVMGASIALSGATACTRQPVETIVPYVRAPEYIVPGKPLYFATAIVTNGLAQGVLVESHMGRPTKIEGNPLHPASLGATDVVSQAAVLTLYDPDRAKAIQGPSGFDTWAEFELQLNAALAAQSSRAGRGLRILTETVTSPTSGAQIRALLQKYPEAKWHQYEPCGPHAARAASQQAFGRPLNTYYKLDAANVIVALDSDFLACGPTSTRYAHDFAQRRRVRRDRLEMNRLYVAESTMTSTGGKADHRWPLRPSQMEDFAGQLSRAAAAASPVGSGPFDAIAADLRSNHGSAVVIPGDTAPPRVHAIAQYINGLVGANGATVIHTEPVEVQQVDQIASLRELVDDMSAGRVELLVIIGGNPVYNAPADIPFAQALRKVPMRVRLGLYLDETSALCNWNIPETHSLEAWSDARAFDGTATILQPLISPLYAGRSAHELLALLNGDRLNGYDIVRGYWQTQATGDFEPWWRRVVQQGVVPGTALPPVNVTAAAPPAAAQAEPAIRGLEFSMRADPYLLDGRLSNNAWLMELPRPMTKLTWDNAVLLNPATAARLGVGKHDVVEMVVEQNRIRGSVWILPGQPDDCVTLHLGYGRTKGGRVAEGAGFNIYPLRTSSRMWHGAGLQINKTGEQYFLACTQHHQHMEGRDLIISSTLDKYRSHPDFVIEKTNEPPEFLTLYPRWEQENYAWGMSIDLTACVNCNACVIACQAENNIPVVGKEQVLMSREMHWLRIDTYYEGEQVDAPARYQPVPCMHCETAPCELVCPVQATVHSDDGLNDMVYNRCVGTRYCSNNCPYKVRRFNFLLYTDWEEPTLKMLRNPDVTVRSRGVMEKCTYCVQRIRQAQIAAEMENRPIPDGAIRTACQQVCPTQAIIFGNMKDPNAQVSQLKKEKLNYGLLAELNTRPRTSYLAELRNPNPAIPGGANS